MQTSNQAEGDKMHARTLLCACLLSTVVVFIGWASWSQTLGAQSGNDINKDMGLLTRIEKLEAELVDQRQSLASQAKLVAALQEELKSTKEVNKVLSQQLIDNRKEVYGDIATIVNHGDYSRATVPDNSHGNVHKHFDQAQAAGYVAGVPNGHLTASRIGTIRFMPLSLLEKCAKIGKQ